MLGFYLFIDIKNFGIVWMIIGCVICLSDIMICFIELCFFMIWVRLMSINGSDWL